MPLRCPKDDSVVCDSISLHVSDVHFWYLTAVSLGVKAFDGNSDLYQGDIVLDPDTRRLLREDTLPNRRRRRAVKKLQQARWPNGVVPYMYEKDLGKSKATSLAPK